MGCLRLDIEEHYRPTLKVVHGDGDVAQRWLSTDPLAQKFASWSPYNYVLGNPVNLIDPDGRAPGDPPGSEKGFFSGFTSSFKSYYSNIAQAASTAEFWIGSDVLSNPASLLEQLLSPTPITTGPVNTGIAIAQGDMEKAGSSVGEFAAEGTLILVTDGVVRGVKSPVVTEATIAKALKDSPMKTVQSEVSLPVVKRYVDKLKAGEQAPPIKVADGVIVDGNHRYVAGEVNGTPPAQVPSVLPSSSKSLVRPVKDMKVNKTDYGNE